ncbi:MAG TPA: GMC family oxidoreductase [Candidatus Sulfotelmatobacter sp.]|nr:GMC family oxidoreductase [Candidatus Sulfotelmatobacter sp.]
MSSTTPRQADCEYIVVGSGAGGGTVASRLALAGRSVILLEAGGDPRKLRGGDPIQPEANRLPADYDVPAFHAFASENSAIKWDFYVRHYSHFEQQRLDPKYIEERDGVLYPRAGTLGGCTAHNAQILVYPHNSDWEYIADLTQDESWGADRMRTYFERLENCHHRPLHRLLSKIGLNPSRHGWKGWLRTEKAIPMESLLEKDLFHTLADCVKDSLIAAGHVVERLGWFLESWGDPNDWRLVEKNAIGSRYLPLTTKNHARTGSRELVLETARKHRNFRVELNALATKVLFDENNRAIGVEYLRGENLYRASSQPSQEMGEIHRIFASKEVILAGGAFNTPQLLMLSGIGPREELEPYGIRVLVDLPGVGKNLQDRYEIAVGHRMNRPLWELYKRVKFSSSDPQFQQWNLCRTGIYATNGSVLSFFKQSPIAEGPPDLFCMALLANFQGYFPNYSCLFARDLNYLTWVVLKAHTRNRAGSVTLRSPDPRDMPRINFRYFEEGADQDMEAVIDGIRFVRALACELKDLSEEFPGKDVNTDEELKAFVRNNAWGHHASCTCAIGPRDKGGVLTSDFRVHGTTGLRVVDASVFPRIPGVFIVSAIYMIGEKAADVILAG